MRHSNKNESTGRYLVLQCSTSEARFTRVAAGFLCHSSCALWRGGVWWFQDQLVRDCELWYSDTCRNERQQANQVSGSVMNAIRWCSEIQASEQQQQTNSYPAHLRQQRTK